MIRQVERSGKYSTYSGDFVLAVSVFSFGKRSGSVGQGDNVKVFGGVFSRHYERVLISEENSGLSLKKASAAYARSGNMLFGVQ